MITKKIEKAINEQIKEEEHSSRIYLAMASWCDANGFPGAAAFFYRQTQEERFHALKFIQHLNERGGHAILSALPLPDSKYKSIKEVFEKTLEHEKHITACINNLYDIAMQEKDFSSLTWLQWFVNEQIEEEATVRSILDKFELIGSDKSGYYMLDKELEVLAQQPVGVDANA